MRLFSISFLLLLFSFVSHSQAQSYSSTEGGFSINFPKTPTVTKNMLPLDEGRSVEMVSTIYQASKNKAFVVIYADDLAGNFTENLSEEEQIIKIKNSVIRNMQVIINEEKEVNIGGYKGLFIKANSATIYTHYLFLLVGDRIYQVFILQQKKGIKEKESKAFFDSFQLNP